MHGGGADYQLRGSLLHFLHAHARTLRELRFRRLTLHHGSWAELLKFLWRMSKAYDVLRCLGVEEARETEFLPGVVLIWRFGVVRVLLGGPRVVMGMVGFWRVLMGLFGVRI